MLVVVSLDSSLRRTKDRINTEVSLHNLKGKYKEEYILDFFFFILDFLAEYVCT